MPQYSLSRLMTIDEAAEYLGMSSKTLDRHRRSGDIAYLQIGRYVRIRFDDLLEAIERWKRNVIARDRDSIKRAAAPRSVTRTSEGEKLAEAYALALSLTDDSD